MQTGSGWLGRVNHAPTAALVTPHHHLAPRPPRRCARAPAAGGNLHGGDCMHRRFSEGVLVRLVRTLATDATTRRDARIQYNSILDRIHLFFSFLNYGKDGQNYTTTKS